MQQSSRCEAGSGDWLHFAMLCAKMCFHIIPDLILRLLYCEKRNVIFRYSSTLQLIENLRIIFLLCRHQLQLEMCGDKSFIKRGNCSASSHNNPIDGCELVQLKVGVRIRNPRGCKLGEIANLMFMFSTQKLRFFSNFFIMHLALCQLRIMRNIDANIV